MIVKKIAPIFSVMLFFFLLMNCQKEQIDQKPNVLLICVDDLRPELKSFGASYISSPNIDALAEKGIKFQKHFVNSPSCGPSRYTLLTGQFGPASNSALFHRANKIKEGTKKVDKSMPEWFKANGYTTVSVGKISHHPGGRGGKNWNDSTKIEMPHAWDKHLMPVAEWKHPRGMMHGLANGQIRVKSGDMDVFETVEGDDNIYPDGAITDEALNQLKTLANSNGNPFFFSCRNYKTAPSFWCTKNIL
jgi:iduronate 2-sulfatase